VPTCGRADVKASVLAFAGALALVLAASCSRNPGALTLTAPFNEDTKLGELTAVWKATGQERAFANASRLKEPEVEVQYRVDAQNSMKDPVFVRLGGFELLSGDGLALARDEAQIECALAPGRTQGVLSGSVWIAKSAAAKAGRFDVRRFAAPLGERGRALHREWLRQNRPGQDAAVDAELQAYGSAPACTAAAEHS
jgi:hypothetical protein